MRSLAVVIGSSLVLAACGGGEEPTPAGKAAPDATKVSIKAFQFQPDPLEVKAGTTVVFENLDSTIHTVTQKGTFDHSLKKGEKVEITFDKAGTVDYVCTLHSGPGMKGKVVVS